MSEIPVIDISSHLAGGDSRGAAAAIDAAATEVGFFQIVGHGFDERCLDAVYEAVSALHRLPESIKEGLISPSGHPYRGVHLKRDETGIVRQERFLATRYDDPDEAIANGVSPELADFFDPNVWPDEVPAFRDAVRELFVQSQQLGHRMMELFALAFGLDADYFDPSIEPNASSFAVNHYPARGAPLDVDPTVLFAEHTDGNTLTVLHQRGDYEGLEVQRLDRSDEWIPVPVRDDAFVINLGELMTRLDERPLAGDPASRRCLERSGCQPHDAHHLPHAGAPRGGRSVTAVRRGRRSALRAGDPLRVGAHAHPHALRRGDRRNRAPSERPHDRVRPPVMRR